MISVGITTRNRSKYLDLALQHFVKYSSVVDEIYIIDDGSDYTYQNFVVIKEWSSVSRIPISYSLNGTRLGIAKSKNKCLRHMQDSDHLFLFDDDCFPKKLGWEYCFIKAAQQSNVHHLMFLTPFSIIQPVQKMEHITAYNNCAGVMLYLNKYALDTVGGYDSRFGLYGYEHAQYSQRMFKAGLTGSHPYNTPNNANDYIYSLDINWGWNQQLPPLGDFDQKLYSSVTQEEAKTAQDNAWLMNDYNIKVPL